MANLLNFNGRMYNTQAKIHLKWDMSENKQLLANEIQRKSVLALSLPRTCPAATVQSSPPCGYPLWPHTQKPQNFSRKIKTPLRSVLG